MPELVAIACPDCGKALGPIAYSPDDQGSPPTTVSYATCLRRCEDCGVGFSNARDASCVTKIYRDPTRNVPAPLRGGLLETLGLAMNVRNRENKREKLAFETSEDAATWTVFRYLQNAGLLRLVVEARVRASTRAPADEPALLLWGAPVPAGDVRARAIRARLGEILCAIGENPDWFSEPDVALDLGLAGIVMIEVKHRSPNDRKDPDYGGWPRYLADTDVFADTATLRRSGHYELARNWRIGCDLAGDRPFTLVNLGPEALFEGVEGERLAEFERCLRAGETRRFRRLSWPVLLDALAQPESWFADYAARLRGGRG